MNIQFKKGAKEANFLFDKSHIIKHEQYLPSLSVDDLQAIPTVLYVTCKLDMTSKFIMEKFSFWRGLIALIVHVSLQKTTINYVQK